jgi:ADP-heptose:LPS heptosyltransferase
MPKLLIENHFRLGDIVHTLPVAYHYHKEGWEVDYECGESYHSLFDLVDYVKPTHPNNRKSNYDWVLCLQVWPKRFDEWQTSKLPLFDFVYNQVKEVTDRKIRLNLKADINVPDIVKRSTIVFPTGYSSTTRHNPRDIVKAAHSLFPNDPMIVIGEKAHGLYELPSIPHLVQWIHTAKNMVTVNSAPTIIASAIRDSYHHVFEPDPMSNWVSNKQILINI